jgi:DNA-directed RNA polymerase subunit N (RpoN/RPB10)
MTSVNLALPILQCTSCNRYIGHLIKDYKNYKTELEKLIKTGHNFETKVEMITTDKRDIYDLFIQPYFLYSDDKDRDLFDIKALLCYALFTKKKLTKDNFPFRNYIKDNYRYCCNRMLLCDFSKTIV